MKFKTLKYLTFFENLINKGEKLYLLHNHSFLDFLNKVIIIKFKINANEISKTFKIKNKKLKLDNIQDSYIEKVKILQLQAYIKLIGYKKTDIIFEMMNLKENLDLNFNSYVFI